MILFTLNFKNFSKLYFNKTKFRLKICKNNKKVKEKVRKESTSQASFCDRHLELRFLYDLRLPPFL